MLGPAPILAALVGVFHTGLYVLVRGSAGGRLPVVLVAAMLGAWAGDAIGARLGMGILVMGDFHLVTASLVAWLGIALVAVLAILGPSGRSAT